MNRSGSEPGRTFESFAKAISEQTGLTQEAKRHLERWQHDDRNPQAWTKIADRITSKHGDLADIYCQHFIEEVLAHRELAFEFSMPDYLGRAKDAERLARFLRGIPPPAPEIKDYLELASRLNNAASVMRESHAKGQTALGRPSHKKSSQPRVQFMRVVSDLLNQFCGRFLDEQAAILTDIAFPDHETSIESVRAARLSTRRRPSPRQA